MKKFEIRFLNPSVFVFALVFSLFTNLSAMDDKITPADLIAKHLESIGSSEARAAVKSVTIIGTSKATFFGRGGGQAEGISVLASESEKYLVAMKFNTSDYPFEKFAYDSEDFLVGFVKPGIRTNLGQFLLTNKTAFKRGLIGGALFPSWELLNFDEKDAKLKYGGTKKIDGKNLYKLEYNPKKGSELNMVLYFDTETFRHVRTEYTRVISARQGASVDASAGQSETRYKMVEEFSDFKEESKLTLPHTYKIFLEILTGNGTTSSEWVMNLQKFNFNQSIDAEQFKVESY